MSKAEPFILRAAAAAGAYLGAAMLAAWVQPAGYALPVFPAAGVGLVCLLVFGFHFWPALWLAAFGFAVGHGLDLTGQWGASGFAAALAVGSGATLGMLAGAFLVRRFVGFPTLLDTPREIMLFVLLGGPVACLVSPSIGVASLLALDLLPLDSAWPSWRDWWVGDSLGILIGAPITFVMIGEPREVWRRRLPAIVPSLSIAAVLIAALLLQVLQAERDAAAESFRARAATIARAIAAQMRAAERAAGDALRTASIDGADDVARVLTKIQRRDPSARFAAWLVPADQTPPAEQAAPGGLRFTLGSGGGVWRVRALVPQSAANGWPALGPGPNVPIDALSGPSADTEGRGWHAISDVAASPRDPIGPLLLQAIETTDSADSGDGGGRTEPRSLLLIGYDIDVWLRAVSERLPRSASLRFCPSEMRAPPDGQGARAPCQAGSFMPGMLGLDIPLELGTGAATLRVSAPLLTLRPPEGAGRVFALLLSGLVLLALYVYAVLLSTGNTRRALDMVRERTRELDLSARVFESTAEGIIITDAHNRIVSVNPAFTAITGYRPAEVIGEDPRIFASGEHDAGYFVSLWDSLTQTGRWQGELTNRRKNGESYPVWMTISSAHDQDGSLVNFIATFTDISQQKRAAEHIHHLAYFDALTGLANRTFLELRGDQAISAADRYHHLLAVLFLDLDRFKTINDSLGHLAGDQLLQTVAERLRGSVRDEDTVARLGGDEFVVLLAELSRREDAALVARKIIEFLSRPMQIENQELSVTVSVGISLYPFDGRDFATLVKNADVALYRVKEEGRNGYQFFEAAMSAHSFERLVLENALRGALDRDELVLYFQPQVDIATGLVVGAEALLRWNHPGMGLLQPNKFIRLAEETGTISSIGQWVINTVCRNLARWKTEGVPCTTIAVNISALQFKHELAQLVLRALEESCVPSRLLELELTESLLMSSAEESIKTLERLHQMGVRLSIDDFGTGYSSLSYLKRFPIHKLKIDREFIRDIPGDPNDEAITRTIIGLASNLHLRVIAEGVETQSQMDFLYSIGCHEVQGAHIARPMPAEEFAAWMRVRGSRRYAAD